MTPDQVDLVRAIVAAVVNNVMVWVGTRAVVHTLVAAHWLRDMATTEPGNLGLEMPQHVVDSIRVDRGWPLVFPPLPLDAHLQPRMIRRLRTWDVYVPRPFYAAVMAGVLDFYVDEVPPRTRYRLVPVDPPRPPRGPRGGLRVRLPRPRPVRSPVPTWGPTPGWAGA